MANMRSSCRRENVVLYPAGSLHRVTPVTRMRLCSFFWIQSMIRDDGQRGLLFDLDGAIQDAGQQLGAGHGVVVRLTATYHNLLRRWAHPSASPPPKHPGVPDAAGPAALAEAASGATHAPANLHLAPACHLRTRPKTVYNRCLW